MLETLQDHHSTISIGGRTLSNLRFADDIDLMAGSNSELQSLTNRLVDRAGACGMEVSTEKSKVMVNSSSPADANITMDGQQLETVDHFKYLGAILTSDGSCTAEIRARIASALAAMARLSRIWKSDMSFQIKHKLYKSLVVSSLLYGCEAWTLHAETERRIQAFEFKCLRRLLRISYREHKTNNYVWATVNTLVGPQEPLLATVKRRKLAWFGHLTRHNCLAKTILQGTLEGGRKQGRQRKSWTDNIKEWTSLTTPKLLRMATDREEWRRVAAKTSLKSPLRPARPRDE